LSNVRYGDYEHLAYALELVPAAMRSLKNAEVVIPGNSRTQAAFSTPQVDHFFRARSISYHVLGFGYGEPAEFAAYLFKKYHLAPRVLIINADPFFTDGLTTPAEQAVAAGPQVWVEATDENGVRPCARFCVPHLQSHLPPHRQFGLSLLRDRPMALARLYQPGLRAG
jgi:hypothetical protein